MFKKKKAQDDNNVTYFIGGTAVGMAGKYYFTYYFMLNLYYMFIIYIYSWLVIGKSTFKNINCENSKFW